jgi:hypothetical protein
MLRAEAATQAPAAANDALERKFTAVAGETKQRLEFTNGRFSGGGLEWLLERGRKAHFFMLGEEHGIAENPKLAAQLFTTLVPHGFNKVAVEISPPMAREIDRTLSRGGIDGLKALFADRGSNVAFFGMREEAEWLAAARRAVPPRESFLWGTDYEAFADRHLISLLEKEHKPKAAELALTKLKQASRSSWDNFDKTGDYKYMYTFSGDPSLVESVRSAWPNRSLVVEEVLGTLSETFEINRLWTQKKGFESNQRRASFLRANFLKHWKAERKAGRTPRVFMKYGATHLIRGRNTVEAFDMGSLVPELAAIEGVTSFSVLVLPGKGTKLGAFDPKTFGVRPVSTDEDADYIKGLKALYDQAFTDAFTVYDTKALRPLLGHSSAHADPDLKRLVHGFDAIVIMSGSTASSAL